MKYDPTGSLMKMVSSNFLYLRINQKKRFWAFDNDYLIPIRFSLIPFRFQQAIYRMHQL